MLNALSHTPVNHARVTSAPPKTHMKPSHVVRQVKGFMLVQLRFYISPNAMVRMTENGLDILRTTAASRGGECLSTQYMGATKKHHFRCAHGHEWFATSQNVRSGTWCPFCKGRQFDRDERLKNAQRIAASKGGQCLSESIAKANDRLHWRCAEGHEWKTIYQSVLEGTWCAVCAGLKVDAVSRLKIAKEVAGRKGGLCLSESYSGAHAPMRWGCAKGHEWKANYGGVVSQGTWCPYCAGKKRTLNDQMQKAHEVANCKGGACLSDKYIKSITPMRWKCAKGHEWQAPFRNVVENGTWCPLCGGTRADANDQLKAAQELALAKGGACLSESYSGSDEPMLWRCKRGHEWLAKHYNVVGMAGTWCPICSSGLKERLARHAIEQLFELPFKKHRPKWLKNPKTGASLELDGFNPELNLAFEYQGEQHYQVISGFQMDESDLEINRYRDAVKKSLCESHGIELLEIPFNVEANLLLEWIADEISRNPKLIHLTPRMKDWRSLTPTEWVESDSYSIESLKAHAQNLNGECLAKTYSGTSAKYRWKCAKGHEWDASWANVKHKSSWCPVCSGFLILDPMNQLHQIAESKGGQCLSTGYLGARTKHLFQCHAGHEWLATPDSIKRGSWCIACLGRVGPDEHLKMIKEVATTKGGRCLSDVYLGGNEKLRFQCAAGHEWSATPNNVKRTSWCPVCAKQRFKTR